MYQVTFYHCWSGSMKSQLSTAIMWTDNTSPHSGLLVQTDSLIYSTELFCVHNNRRIESNNCVCQYMVT